MEIALHKNLQPRKATIAFIKLFAHNYNILERGEGPLKLMFNS